MAACDAILADKSLKVAPDALAFCERMVKGCYGAPDGWEPGP